jgi:TrmH family RNA methyltransferase
MRKDYPVETLLYSPGIKDKGDLALLQFLSTKAQRTIYVSDEIMDYVSPAKTSQKILAIVPKLKWDPEEVMQKSGFFLALNQPTDPGNLGTLIRSACAFGCSGMLLIGSSVEWFNPRTVRSSAGYILEMPYINFKDTDEFLQSVKGKFRLISFSPRGDENHDKIAPVNGTIYVMGGETSGVDSRIESESDAVLRIPMEEKIESLNLAISGSIVLHEVYGKK